MINQDTLKMKICLHSIYHPIQSSTLEIEFNCAGSVIRDGVRALRRAGVPIASCSDGYFLAETYGEIESTIEDLKSRAISLFETAGKLAGSFNVDIQNDLFV